jgi:hypothetical protein
VLDSGATSGASEFDDKVLQTVMGEWIGRVHVIVLEPNNFDLDGANVEKIMEYFSPVAHAGTHVRVFVRDSRAALLK